ncbi:MAG: methylated-DNA--[protein]-cysteine S-methyltransferase, partial [Legionellales bacterium]|nr:methylated-DNA--[protein]-cysteine S-methyltransferase [Legionellales bacterium]
RRMGIAFKQIRSGQAIIETQLDTGYESSSGFRDAFTRIMGAAPAKIDKNCVVLKSSWIDTPLGAMCAIGDDTGLYLLEFVDRRGLEKEIETLRIKQKATIIPGSSRSIESIRLELIEYFSGFLKRFKTPIHLIGSSFQKKIWDKLLNIPYGETRNYSQIAVSIGNTKSHRAVANANGANQLAIIIPCHRVINKNGELGGYGGGLLRKKKLLEIESRVGNTIS